MGGDDNCAVGAVAFVFPSTKGSTTLAQVILAFFWTGVCCKSSNFLFADVIPAFCTLLAAWFSSPATSLFPERGAADFETLPKAVIRRLGVTAALLDAELLGFSAVEGIFATSSGLWVRRMREGWLQLQSCRQSNKYAFDIREEAGITTRRDTTRRLSAQNSTRDFSKAFMPPTL
jgi:hypothetical protein